MLTELFSVKTKSTIQQQGHLCWFLFGWKWLFIIWTLKKEFCNKNNIHLFLYLIYNIHIHVFSRCFNLMQFTNEEKQGTDHEEMIFKGTIHPRNRIWIYGFLPWTTKGHSLTYNGIECSKWHHKYFKGCRQQRERHSYEFGNNMRLSKRWQNFHFD